MLATWTIQTSGIAFSTSFSVLLMSLETRLLCVCVSQTWRTKQDEWLVVIVMQGLLYILRIPLNLSGDQLTWPAFPVLILTLILILCCDKLIVWWSGHALSCLYDKLTTTSCVASVVLWLLIVMNLAVWIVSIKSWCACIFPLCFIIFCKFAFFMNH